MEIQNAIARCVFVKPAHVAQPLKGKVAIVVHAIVKVVAIADSTRAGSKPDTVRLKSRTSKFCHEVLRDLTPSL